MSISVICCSPCLLRSSDGVVIIWMMMVDVVKLDAGQAVGDL